MAHWCPSVSGVRPVIASKASSSASSVGLFHPNQRPSFDDLARLTASAPWSLFHSIGLIRRGFGEGVEGGGTSVRRHGTATGRGLHRERGRRVTEWVCSRWSCLVFRIRYPVRRVNTSCHTCRSMSVQPSSDLRRPCPTTRLVLEGGTKWGC